MLDRTIPFYNTILKCENYIPSKILLPKGYSFRNYQAGDEKAWAKLEYEIGDFKSLVTAENYFLSEYGQNIHDLKERCVFVVTCSRHLTKNHPLDNFLQEVGASCSSQTSLTVSTGYPREPHGFFFIPSKHPLTHVPDRTEMDFVC